MIQFEYNCSKSEKIFFDMKRIYDSPGHKSKVLEDGNDDNTCITGSSTSIANWLVSECGQKNSQLPLAQSASAKRHKELKSFRKKIEQDHPIRIQHPKSTGFLKEEPPVISQSDACELLQFDNLPSRLHTIVRCIYGILTTYYSIVVHPILVHYELDCSVEDDCLSEKEKERYREMMSTHWPVSPMDRKRLLKFWESFAQHKDQRRINLKNSLSEFNWLIFRDDLISAGTCGKELALVLNVIIMDREYPKAGFPRAIYRALLRPIEGGLFSCDVSLCRLRIERKYLSWLVHAFEHIQQGLVLAQQLACGESTVQRQQSMSTKVIKKAAVSRTVFVAVDTIVSVPNCQESDSCECSSESCIWINMLLFALSVCHPYDCLNVLYLSDTHDGPCLSSGGSKSPTRDGIGSFSPPASPAKASRPSSQSSPLIRNSWDVSWKTLPAKTLRKSKTASICCASMFVDNGESSSPQSGTISSAGTASPTGRKRRRRKQAWDKVVFALSRRYGDAPQYSLKEMQRPVSTTARHTACDHQCAAECVAGSGKECGVGTPSLVSEEDEDSRRPHRSLFEVDIMDKIFAPALALHRQECRRRKACGRTSSASDDTPLVVLTDNTILGESGCTMNSERYGAEQIFSAVSSLLTAGCNVAVACLPMRVNVGYCGSKTETLIGTLFVGSTHVCGGNS